MGRWTQCQQYNTSSFQWKYAFDIYKERKRGAAAVVVSDDQWLFLGGNGTTTSRTSEMCKLSTGACLPFVALPEGDEFGSIAALKVNSSHVFIKLKKNWMLNIQTRTFLPLPDLIDSDRPDPGMGMITKSDGTRSIVITGGAGKKSTEILDIDSQFSLFWQEGPYFEFGDFLEHCNGGLTKTTSVQYGDTFLLIGGEYERHLRIGPSIPFDSNGIYTFDVENYQWKRLPRELQIPRHSAAAVLIPSNYIPCVR